MSTTYMRLIINSIAMFTTISLVADPAMTFFFEEFPVTIETSKKLLKDFSHPKKFAYHQLNAFSSNKIKGIIVLYAGYFQVSNAIGQVSFARKQVKPILQLLVTEKVEPVILYANTVAHWHLAADTPASLYTIAFINDDKIGSSFFEISCASLADAAHIKSDTMIILANPKNIIVPLGITLANQDANLILPSIYVKKGINKFKNSLYFLTISPFFRHQDILYQKKDNRVFSNQ